jgi:hypothetical protein
MTWSIPRRTGTDGHKPLLEPVAEALKMRGELQEPVLARIAYRPDKMADMDLSRICAAPSARLGH